MYINLNILKNKGLSLDDYLTLVLIRQQRSEDVELELKKRLDADKISFLKDKGYIESIIGKSNQSEISKLRVSSKGREVLESIETAEVEEQDIILRDWLVKYYQKEDKMIGNKKRIAYGLAQFRSQTGIEKNNLAFLLKEFLNDEKNFQYNQKLENLFFDPSSVFDRKFSLDKCRLWDYYDRRRDYINRNFK